MHNWYQNSTVYLNYQQCFQKLNRKDTSTLGLQSTRMFAELSIMKDVISKLVKKLSSEKSYGKTADIFQNFVTFSQQKNKNISVCIIDIGELIEI